MARLGLEGNAGVRITQTVDAMLIDSTAYVVQSRCGRVVIPCYRGTEPATLGNWLGHAAVDHVFVRGLGLDSSVAGARDVKDASDHRPVWADLRMGPALSARNDQHSATSPAR